MVLAMALLAPVLPGDYWMKGTIIGAIGWMIGMMTLMPAAGKGFFGLKIGPSAPIMAMMMHLVFGAMLGLLYGWMLPAVSFAQ